MDHAKRNELLAQLGAEVEALRSSDRWARWLRTASKFRRYSLNNQILICAATRRKPGRRIQAVAGAGTPGAAWRASDSDSRSHRPTSAGRRRNRTARRR